jgi:hypothetical protein
MINIVAKSVRVWRLAIGMAGDDKLLSDQFVIVL